MNQGSLRAAQAIPGLVEGINRSLGELKDSLSELHGLMAGAQRLTGTPTVVVAKPARPPAPAGAGKAGRSRRRRGRKVFPTAVFVMEQLSKSPKGLRPREIGDALKKTAPGVHKDATASVNTALARLRDQKRVVNNDGTWSLAAKKS